MRAAAARWLAGLAGEGPNIRAPMYAPSMRKEEAVSELARLLGAGHLHELLEARPHGLLVLKGEVMARVVRLGELRGQIEKRAPEAGWADCVLPESLEERCQLRPRGLRARGNLFELVPELSVARLQEGQDQRLLGRVMAVKRHLPDAGFRCDHVYPDGSIAMLVEEARRGGEKVVLGEISGAIENSLLTRYRSVS